MTAHAGAVIFSHFFWVLALFCVVIAATIRKILRRARPSPARASVAGDPPYQAVCMTCGHHRAELSPEWLEGAPAGRSPMQIDSGEDFAFSGLIVRAPGPCPRCKKPAPQVALVRAFEAEDIGGYIERHLWQRDREQ